MPSLGTLFGGIVARVKEYVKERLPSTLLPLAEEAPQFLRKQILRIALPELRSSFTTSREFKTSTWVYSLITVDPPKVHVLPNQMIAVDVPLIGPDGRYIRFELRLPSGKPLDPALLDRKIAAQLAEEWKKRGIKTPYAASEYVKLSKMYIDYYLITREIKAQAVA